MDRGVQIGEDFSFHEVINALIRKALYKLAWDTRCRNVDVARLLGPRVAKDEAVLDAGCGEYGLAAFVKHDRIVGIDVLPTDARIEGFSFVHGSILELPFVDRQFPVAASVDVLEHLPADLRPRAVAELVRAASRAVIITFPSGKAARQVDEQYYQRLEAAGDDIPDWLAEHLADEYPEVAEISQYVQTEARRSGRKVRIAEYYSEPVAVGKKLRDLSSRSKYLYLIANMAAGMLLPAMPTATRENAYRAIVLAEFIDD